MNIDWSNAPEDTTHFHPMAGGYVPHWVKIDGSKSWFCVTGFEKKGWRKDFGMPSKAPLIKRPEQVSASIKERDKACDAMYGVILGMPEDRRHNRSDIVEALYDSGYRKQ